MENDKNAAGALPGRYWHALDDGRIDAIYAAYGLTYQPPDW